MPRLQLLAALLLACALPAGLQSGCGFADDGREPALPADGGGGGNGNGDVMDVLEQCFDESKRPPPPSMPSLDPVDTPTSFNVIALTGQANGAGDIVVEGGRAVASAQVDVSGQFCVLVPLQEGQRNALSVRAISGDICGVWSEAVTAMVEHVPLPGDDPDRPPVDDNGLRNVAKEKTVLGSVPVADGSPQKEALVDGDTATVVEITTTFFGTDRAWFRVDLGDSFAVDRVEVVFPGEEGAADDDWSYASVYSILLSNAETVPEPDPDPEIMNNPWTVVGGSDSGRGGTEGYTVNPPPGETEHLARYAALVMDENASLGVQETYRVAEFRIFGRLPGEQVGPGNGDPRCPGN